MTVEDFAEAASSAPKPRTINLLDHDAADIPGPVPPTEWLVQGTIPLGVPMILAAMGDTGKSFLGLQLCLRVTQEKSTGNLDFGIPVFGGQVVAHGSAVFITTEDNKDELHRRLASLDPEENRRKRPGKLYTVALPNAGGPLALFTRNRDSSVGPTAEWDMICGQLSRLTEPKLVVFDPLSTFAQIELDADNCGAGVVAASFGALATELGATVMATHHMRKQGKAPGSLAEARERIRGASNIVDGARLAYALWPVDDDEGKKICEELRIPFKPGQVVKGGVVKANGQASREIATYVRNEHGLLIDRSGVLAAIRRGDPLQGQDCRRLSRAGRGRSAAQSPGGKRGIQASSQALARAAEFGPRSSRAHGQGPARRGQACEMHLQREQQRPVSGRARRAIRSRCG